MNKRKNLILAMIVMFLVILGILVMAAVYLSKNNEGKVVDGGTVENGKEVGGERSYAIVDTGQIDCYDNSSSVECPELGDDFYGQDGNFKNLEFSYTDNGDGTVTDNNTGLVWQQSADLNDDGVTDVDDKLDQTDAENYCGDLDLAGFDDWRLPDIKTLYSLMNFSAFAPSEPTPEGNVTYISTEFFDFAYGDESAGERAIDSQWATTSIYVDKVMSGSTGMFGLNLADGRIKGYPVSKLFYVRCVRGNEQYGKNNFVDNGNGTITDDATGLMWQQEDSGEGQEWKESLVGCEASNTGGYSDWRLPNVKELQSIVDYSRSPGTSDSAPIDPIFSATSITNEAGERDWGFYWASTTHAQAGQATYVSFGRALGYMIDGRTGKGSWQDVHGAGAQRSDPKVSLDIDNLPGTPGGDNQFKVVDGAIAHGPQGDVIRSNNFYRCVRGFSGSYSGEVTQSSDASTDIADGVGWSSGSDTNIQTSGQGTNTQTSGQLDPQGSLPDGSQDDGVHDGDELKEPPQAAIEACEGGQVNSTCSIKIPDGTVTGKCLQVPTGDLACVPEV